MRPERRCRRRLAPSACARAKVARPWCSTPAAAARSRAPLDLDGAALDGVPDADIAATTSIAGKGRR